MLRRLCAQQAASLVKQRSVYAPSHFTRSVLPAFLTQRRCYAEQSVKVPEMAESISEGTLKQWSKKEGEYVEQDEEIATIETDKIDVSVNAPTSGTITQILAQEEDTVTVGQEIAKLDDSGSPSSGGGGGGGKEKSGGEEESSSKESSSQESSAQQSSSQGGNTHTITTQQSSAPDSGRKDSTSGADPKSKATQEDDEATNLEGSQHQEKPPPSPAGGKQSGSQPPAPRKEPEQQPPKREQPKKQDSKSSKAASGGPQGTREEQRVKMNRMRLRIAERLKQSQNTAASLTTFQKVDMTNLMEWRKKYKDDILKQTGVKLGFMGPFARASILAMKTVPTVNASIEGPGGGDTIVYRDYVDVSVAVATEKGLVTPVVRNAEGMDILGIESAIAELGKKARDNKLTIEDMAGGTYTISNGGIFGSLFGTPIINLPQTAVLGLHAINKEAVWIDGKFEPRDIMYLALTYDHRLLDGREAVTFLVKIKQYIEDPARMLLGF